MNRIGLATALTAFLFLAPACSESEAASVAGVYELEANATMTGSVELKADLTFSTTMTVTGAPSASTTKGTWSVKDGTVTAEQTHANDKEEAKTETIVYKDGTLVYTEEKAGKTIKMVFAKKK